WNVLALDRAGRVLVALRQRRTAHRSLRRGDVYAPPPALDRAGAAAPLDFPTWRALLEPVAPGRRAAVLVQKVAWTSPLNVGAIVGRSEAEAETVRHLKSAFERYLLVVPPAPARPCVLRLEDGEQPYPVRLAGSAHSEADSLLDAFAAIGGGETAPGRGTDLGASGGVAGAATPPELLERLRRAVEHSARRIDRLRAELDDAGPEAARLRRRADLLLAQPHVAPRGTRRIELDDFEGGSLTVELDPALDAVGNAEALYDAAKRRERASVRLPRLIQRRTRELADLRALLERAEAGRADVAELERFVAVRGVGKRVDHEQPLPYRRHRTSGGLEVRVGRGSRANDELTFHHSSPDDIWLHARDVAGAHVILRWGRKDQGPPHRDLIEAAALAARASKARTSGTVAVDWTLRKYVRKPRRAPPGSVVPDRVKTVFVEP
ncbi:MAG: NFACT RNA binding domain-containing protein, partial [Longimicrobiales bacterium]